MSPSPAPRSEPMPGRATTASPSTATTTADQHLRQRRPGSRALASSAPRRVAAAKVASGNPPGGCRGGSPAMLPRRICVPLQSTALGISRPPVSKAARASCGGWPGHLPVAHRQSHPQEEEEAAAPGTAPRRARIPGNRLGSRSSMAQPVVATALRWIPLFDQCFRIASARLYSHTQRRSSLVGRAEMITMACA